jgi:hypothetical protein
LKSSKSALNSISKLSANIIKSIYEIESSIHQESVISPVDFVLEKIGPLRNILFNSNSENPDPSIDDLKSALQKSSLYDLIQGKIIDFPFQNPASAYLLTLLYIGEYLRLFLSHTKTQILSVYSKSFDSKSKFKLRKRYNSANLPHYYSLIGYFNK